MTADELRAELVTMALRAIGQLTGVDPVDLQAMGGDVLLERLCRQYERAEADADTQEVAIYPPAGVWDKPTG